jgi:hypothetical protein
MSLFENNIFLLPNDENINEEIQNNIIENVNQYFDIENNNNEALNNFKNNFQQKIKTTIQNDLLIIPNYKNIEILFKYNYNVSQLKYFIKHYKLKTSGTKKQLLNRIFYFIYYSHFITKIQKIVRGFFQRSLNKLRGPGLWNRLLCNNKNDFLTFENINDIEIQQFFSYKDIDNFIYGFDILSIYNLIYTKKNYSYIMNNEIKNPYNRNIISLTIISNIDKLIKLGKIMKISINVKIKDMNDDISFQKSLEFKALDIFQYINSLGNYSDVSWFLNLNRNKLITFIRELEDIWNFRAQIPNNIKLLICPPNGNPFGNSILQLSNITNNINIFELQKIVLNIIEKLVYSGIDRENKKIGILYVLSALTLVSSSAASALPWLYESASGV